MMSRYVSQSADQSDRTELNDTTTGESSWHEDFYVLLQMGQHSNTAAQTCRDHSKPWFGLNTM